MYTGIEIIPYHRDHEIHNSEQPAREQKCNQCPNQCEASSGCTSAIKQERCFAGKLYQSDRLLNRRWPLKFSEIHAMLQLFLQGGCGIEMEEGGLIRAVCDILGRVGGRIDDC